MNKKVKKKNFYWSLFAIIMVAFLGIGFSACGGDDEDGGSGSGPENGPSNPSGGSNDDEKISIIGTWTGVNGQETLTLTINSEDAGTYVYNYVDSYSGKGTETGTFTYAKESDSKYKIFIKLEENYSGSSEDVFYCVIEGGTMRLYEDNYYDDLEWVLSKDNDSSVTDIVGTWKGIDGQEILTLVFKSKTAGTYDYRYEDSYSGGLQTDKGTFTCSPEDNSTGIIIFEDNSDNDSYDSYSGSSAEIYYYVIVGETMTLYEKKNNYYDLEYVLTKQ